MSTQRASGNQSTGMTNEELLAEIKDLRATVETQSSRIDSVERENQQLKETVSNQSSRIDELQESNELDKARIKQRITEIEESKDEKVGETQTDSQKSQNIEEFSPLGQITNLPEHMVDEQLHANQERARFVARDIQQYGDMRLGEYVISSGDIKKVLAAKEEKSIHWETVGRVIEYLDGMGKGDTRVKSEHGTIVCFNPEAVERYGSTHQTHAVVSEEKSEV